MRTKFILKNENKIEIRKKAINFGLRPRKSTQLNPHSEACQKDLVHWPFDQQLVSTLN